MRALRGWTIAMLLAGCAAPVVPPRDARFEAAAAGEAEARLERIRAEVARRGAHPWAGEYFAGDGTGVNTTLALAPDAGFVFEWHGCLGVYDRNFGTVEVVDGRLVLDFSFENVQEGFRGLAPELLPVAWGPRRYLVPADDVIGFCNEVNGGAEPRQGVHGTFLLRRGDEALAVAGEPALPPDVRDALLERPVEARVIEVGPSESRPGRSDFDFRITRVRLDAGSLQGLRSGMELFVVEPRGLVERVRLAHVEEGRSEGTFTQSSGDRPAPRVGWRLSTRAPWHPVERGGPAR